MRKASLRVSVAGLMVLGTVGASTGVVALSATAASGPSITTVIPGLNTPRGITFDGRGNLYVSESGVAGPGTDGLTTSGRVSKYARGSNTPSWVTGFDSLYATMDPTQPPDVLGPEGISALADSCRRGDDGKGDDSSSGDDHRSGSGGGCQVRMIMSESHDGVLAESNGAIDSTQLGHLFSLNSRTGQATNISDVGDQMFKWTGDRADLFPDVVTAPAAAAEGADGEANDTIVVPRDYPTIQAAVNAAAPGDTINVKRGTYTEEVVITKDLKLRGAGVGKTVIKSPATLTPYAADTDGLPLFAIVRVAHGAHVRISGLTVSGPVPCGLVMGVVAVQSATLKLADARVRDKVPATTTCSSASGASVQFGLGDRALIDGERGTTASGRVTGVMVDNFVDEGLRAVGPYGVPPTSVTFADNVITAGVPPIPAEQTGIDVFLNAVAQVTGNTVSGGVCNIEGCGPDPINEFQAIGIIVGFAAEGTRISGNHFSGAEVGIYQYGSPNCCLISENTLTDNKFFGIVIQDGDGTTRKNRISGGQVGIGVVAGAADTTGVLRGDHISGTTVAPVRTIQCCDFTATAIVRR